INTHIWGPPAWRLIHSVGYCAAPEAAETAGAFFDSLRYVLPCKYCRISYAEFVAVLTQRGGGKTVPQLVRRGRLMRWSYELHELVNDKLDTQHCIAKAVPPCAGRRISWECLLRRHKGQPFLVSAADVLDLLFILALNYPEEEEGAPERRRAYQQLLCGMPALLRCIVQPFHSYPTLAKLGGDLLRLAHCITLLCSSYTLCSSSALLKDNILASRKNLFSGMVVLWFLFYDTRRHSAQDELVVRAELMERYRHARAHVCKHGACK